MQFSKSSKGAGSNLPASGSFSHVLPYGYKPMEIPPASKIIYRS